jgi:hypothetical protein
LPHEPVLSLDETPTKEGSAKRWQWTYVAKEFTLFAVRPTREASGVTDLLGESFPGIVHCDRARMYLSLERLQWCWAHLKRDFQALVDGGDGQAKRLGYDLLRPTRALFRHWAHYRDGTISRAALQRRLAPVRRAVERLLVRGLQSGNRSLVGMCREFARASYLAVGLYPTEGRRTDQQRQRAGLTPCRHLAKALLRHAKRRRQPLRRNHAHGDRNLPPAKSLCVRLPRRSHPSPSRRANVAVIRHRGVNGYVLGEAAIVVANRLMDSLLVVYPGVGGVR